MNPDVKAFFDESTNTVSYVVSDPNEKVCVVIDPVLDFDQASGRTHTQRADELLAYIDENKLRLGWILETHAHADHLTAAQYFKEKCGGETAIGRLITATQSIFKDVFNLDNEFVANGEQFDRLLDDGEELQLGSFKIQVMHTPGHTPACVTYLIGDCAFVGDTLFMPDFGTARVDFPGGDAATLYASIQRIFRLPPATRLFMCHDYKAPGREQFAWESTVAEQLASNLHVKEGTSEAEFIEFRTNRDSKLAVPKLLLPSIQVNIRAGLMPPEDDNGVVYLKLPLNAL